MIHPKENWLTDDDNGIQMPWYVRPLLEEMDRWDLKGNLVYEYGVGYSSNWYEYRGAIVDGVDNDDNWVGYCKTALYTNIREEYVSSIDVYPQDYFDIVVIDGTWRDDCTEHALKRLKSGGKLILDNWLQPSVEPNWPKTEELIKGMDIKVYKQPDHPDWQTAVVTKP